MEQPQTEQKSWYDKYYKLLLIIPVIIVLLSLIYLASFYSQHNDIMNKDVSLSGGTSITIQGDISQEKLDKLKSEYPDISIRKLTNIQSGETIASIIESSSTPDKLQPSIESILGYNLTEENSSIEFSGPSLGNSFYRQLIIAIIASFILMSIVIFLLFKTFIPSLAVIFAALSDIIIPLAIIDYIGMKVSVAGIAAFLMLIGYSVDTDILLTSRALKSGEGVLNKRIYSAFKTGILMTLTALAAVLPAFLIVTGLPDSFRQIFFILSLGLASDILNTWLTNAGIIKWYCDRKGIR
ncbi:protein translocase subunit SecF [Candidatus Pacearchaeota archaeon]|nr:protein translocase subunit SecF [Candidatus Pacearchaeota archaeon]